MMISTKELKTSLPMEKMCFVQEGKVYYWQIAWFIKSFLLADRMVH